MKHNRIIITIGIIGLAALIIMLIFTSPTEIGPLGVLLFFTTIYIVAFSAVALALRFFLRLAIKKQELTKKDYLYSAVFAFGPIMLLMARTFGVANLWVTGLIIAFLCLSEFLVYKKK